ncbi:FkbM family methyltransferase [Luteolibacter sp. LG18]|uniref:FkbM family methyltransferase n=1 Tax=Luteolibacter sp. LG18 TaxID=2819286 RepID=UPI002B30AED5|nr:hypothetical protein llg_08690 [Luteolibacter sp. LG18]
MRLFKKKPAPTNAPNPNFERLVSLLDHHRITVVFDIGANVGQYAEKLRAAGFRGRIVSFEPLSENHRTLETLAAKDSKWTIAPRMAVGAEAGEVSINVSQNNDMSSILPVADPMLEALPKSRIVTTETVQVKTVDSLFNEFVEAGDKVFVKVDTQGFEMPVLEGSTGTIAANRIAGWQLELSMIPLYQGESTFDDITAWLKAKGYETHFIIPGYFSKKLMRQLQIDSIFFKA